MKGFLVVTILAGAIVSLHATCQQDFELCKKTYMDALPKTMGNPAALCMVGNNYISCLRQLTSDPQHHPDCANLTATINDARRKTEQLLNRNVTGCQLCTLKVDICEGAFTNSSTIHSQNTTALCKDAQTLVNCLVNVSGSAECAAERSRVEEDRRKADEKLNQCNSRNSCLTGIHACEAQQAAAKQNATTHAQECKVTGAFYHCLLNQKCTGDSEKELKMAIDSILAEARAGHCPFATGGADAQTSTKILTLTLTSLVVALTAKLN